MKIIVSDETLEDRMKTARIFQDRNEHWSFSRWSFGLDERGNYWELPLTSNPA